MSSAFVWFHDNGQNPKETKEFLEVASKQNRYGDRTEWIPVARR